MKINYAPEPNPPRAYGFAYESVTVPAGRTNDPSFKPNYSYANGMRGAIVVNHSGQTFWVMALANSEPHPTRAQVVDFGIRVNANGGQFVLPDRADCSIYLATSATSALECRISYYLRER